MTLEFVGEIIEWRGPAPFLFAVMPEDLSDLLKGVPGLSYGWGCIPAQCQLGETRWTTALMPKNGRYLVPVKTVVQNAEGVGLGDTVKVSLELG